jgi:uncharacterized protein
MVIIGGWRGGRRYRRRPYDPYYGGGYRTQGSCLRDACLIESGCCLGEALAGNCLVQLASVGPQLALALLRGQQLTTTRSARPGRVATRLVAAVRVYQRTVSPGRSGYGSCRFTPTCSAYAAEAIGSHGALRGLWLTVSRLSRCRPGGRRGPDPVPR